MSDSTVSVLEDELVDDFEIVDNDRFLSLVENEVISTKIEQEESEIQDTYSENIDKAKGMGSQIDLINSKKTNQVEYIVPIQKWLGTVLKVNEEDFEADLDDLIDAGTNESVTLSKREVSPSERALIQEGALFYWYLAYIYKSGTMSKQQVIRFKRFAIRREDKFEEAMLKADEMFEYLKAKRI